VVALQMCGARKTVPPTPSRRPSRAMMVCNRVQGHPDLHRKTDAATFRVIYEWGDEECQE
jgi:hypothetical protein